MSICVKLFPREETVKAVDKINQVLGLELNVSKEYKHRDKTYRRVFIPAASRDKLMPKWDRFVVKLGEKVLGTDDLPVEVEYGADVASHYILSDVEVTPKGLLFVLVGKQTDCLAPDKCGVTQCCAGSGCC